MDNYSVFASVYDILMQDTPYDTWASNIKKIWAKHNLSPSLVADLACGTGTITDMLASDGIDMIGVDLSFDMLIEANSKKQSNILFLNQDIREFELYGTVDSIICICDSLNYILNSTDLLKIFKLVNNYLNPNGLFIFDLNTLYKFEKVLANNTFGANYDNVSYIWENYYDKESNINNYLTSFFIKNKNGLYEKFEEEHQEKGYSIAEITDIIKKSGLILLEILDESLTLPPNDSSERIYFVCKENGKEV